MVFDLSTVGLRLALVWLAWIIFYGYWLLSILFEFATGRYKPREAVGQSFGAAVAQRVLLGAAIVLEVDPILGPLTVQLVPYSLPLQVFGMTVAFAGVGFAIWARQHLGGNWSSEINIKKGHTLIKTGPYGLVRHPIYAGIFFMVLGCAIDLGTIGSAIAISLGLLFVAYRVNVEEGLMSRRFGKEWDIYKKEVKQVIVPGVV